MIHLLSRRAPALPRHTGGIPNCVDISTLSEDSHTCDNVDRCRLYHHEYEKPLPALSGNGKLV